MPLRLLSDANPLIVLLSGGTALAAATAVAKAEGLPDWVTQVKDLSGWAVVAWIVYIMFTRVERKLDRVLKRFPQEKDDENDDEKGGKQG